MEFESGTGSGLKVRREQVSRMLLPDSPVKVVGLGGDHLRAGTRRERFDMALIRWRYRSRSTCVLFMIVICTGCQERQDQDSQASHESVSADDETRDAKISPTATDTTKASEVKAVSGNQIAPDSDEHYRAAIVGTWEDDYQGRRTLTVRKDGTATMVVELQGLAAKIYARRMTFDEKWDIQDGRLKLTTVGGEPAGRVNLILKTMGDSVDQRILELTLERMLLLDADGETKYVWRKVGLGNVPVENRRD